MFSAPPSLDDLFEYEDSSVPTFVIFDHHSPFLLSSAASQSLSSSPVLGSGPKEEGAKGVGPKDDRPQ